MNRKATVVFLRGSMTIALVLCLVFSSFFLVEASYAASAKMIDGRVDFALEILRREMKSGLDYLNAKGVLLIPRVIKAGFIVGGEYEEGALRIGGKTVDYYSLTAGSLGLQFGVQEKNIVLVFMEGEALRKFRESKGWKVGADGAVVLAGTGVGGFTDTLTGKDPILAYVFGQRGFMFNVTLEGAKLTKLGK